MNIRTLIVSLVCVLGFLGSSSLAQVTYPPRPAEGEFVADTANLIDPQDKAKIRDACQQLQQAKGITLMAVTINSMADYGAGGWQIERYAINLFDEWGIGHSGRNTGILVLVSKNDRKVRIEMGAAWTHDKDAVAASVINSVMVPRFKAGDYSGGIRQGVESLATQIGNPPVSRAQGGSSATPARAYYPPPAQPAQSTLHSTGVSKLLGPLACIIVPIVFVIIISIISRAGRGIGGGPGYGGGYGPMGWGGGWGGGGGGGFLSGALLGGLLGNAWGSRNSGGGFFGGSSSSSSSSGFGGGFGGGGFGGGGGGSFGGGFSGGGGATGSW